MHVKFWLHFCYKWYKWCSKSWSYTKLLMHVRFDAPFFIFNMLHARTPKIVTIIHMHVHFNFKFNSTLAMSYHTTWFHKIAALNSWIHLPRGPILPISSKFLSNLPKSPSFLTNLQSPTLPFSHRPSLLFFEFMINQNEAREREIECIKAPTLPLFYYKTIGHLIH